MVSLSITELVSTLWDSLMFWITNPAKFLLPVMAESVSVYDALMWVCLISCLFCLVMFELTHNLSQVDRLWSILPGLYSCIITIYSSSSSSLSSCSTMLLMSLLTSVWGARLTFQFFMKDGYTLTGEDYRWKYVKQVLGDNWWLLQGFNLFFVVIYQNILLFLLVVPQLVMVGEDIAITAVDVLIGCAGFVLIALETVADNQQQCFQRRKYKAISEGAELTGDLKAGFVKGGLFSYCRHPNFVSEVLIWWTFAMFPVSRLGIGWYFVGAVNLTALFCGSQDLTEQISAKKYPEYAEYQKRVPAYIPNLRMMSIK